MKQIMMKRISMAKRFLTALAALAAAPLAWGGEDLPTPVSGVVTLVSGKTYTLTEDSGNHENPCSVTGTIGETYTDSSKTYRSP